MFSNLAGSRNLDFRLIYVPGGACQSGSRCCSGEGGWCDAAEDDVVEIFAGLVCGEERWVLWFGGWGEVYAKGAGLEMHVVR